MRNFIIDEATLTDVRNVIARAIHPSTPVNAIVGLIQKIERLEAVKNEEVAKEADNVVPLK